jgi:hypothetical protein
MKVHIFTFLRNTDNGKHLTNGLIGAPEEIVGLNVVDPATDF